jgi:hypothetical protein
VRLNLGAIELSHELAEHARDEALYMSIQVAALENRIHFMTAKKTDQYTV